MRFGLSPWRHRIATIHASTLPRTEKPSFRAAIETVARHVASIACERVASVSASGRILAEPAFARRNSPPFDMAAMDGFAIGSADLMVSGTSELWLGAPQFAGDAAPPLARREARPIYTGAAVPANAGAVLIQEKACALNNALRLTDSLTPGANIRRMGEDARSGEMVAPAGCRLNACTIGALCSYGVANLDVRRRPRVALLVLGSELASASTAGPCDVVDANGPMLMALIAEAGGIVTQYRRVDDDEHAIRRAFAECLSQEPDLILATGGASVGARDFLRAGVESVGAEVHFHGVHMRPGKPVLFAVHPGGIPIFGLPGNPVAALVGARFFVMAAIRAMLGLAAERPLAILEDAPEQGPTRVLKAQVSGFGAAANIRILPGQQSHMLRPMFQANAWVVQGASLPAAVFPLFDAL